MDNFSLYRNDYDPQNNNRTAYGKALYVTNDIECLCDPFSWNYNNTEITVCIINFHASNIHVVGIYRSKSKFALSKLIEALEHLPYYIKFS